MEEHAFRDNQAGWENYSMCLGNSWETSKICYMIFPATTYGVEPFTFTISGDQVHRKE